MTLAGEISLEVDQIIRYEWRNEDSDTMQLVDAGVPVDWWLVRRANSGVEKAQNTDCLTIGERQR